MVRQSCTRYRLNQLIQPEHLQTREILYEYYQNSINTYHDNNADIRHCNS